MTSGRPHSGFSWPPGDATTTRLHPRSSDCCCCCCATTSPLPSDFERQRGNKNSLINHDKHLANYATAASDQQRSNTTVKYTSRPLKVDKTMLTTRKKKSKELGSTSPVGLIKALLLTLIGFELYTSLIMQNYQTIFNLNEEQIIISCNNYEQRNAFKTSQELSSVKYETQNACLTSQIPSSWLRIQFASAEQLHQVNQTRNMTTNNNSTVTISLDNNGNQRCAKNNTSCTISSSSNATAPLGDHAATNAQPINVLCNSRCKCFKLVLEQHQHDSDRDANDTSSVGRLLRHFSGEESFMFAYDEAQDEKPNTNESATTPKEGVQINPSPISSPILEADQAPRNIQKSPWPKMMPQAGGQSIGQQQQQAPSSMVYPLPSGNQANHHHHQHYRLMLYPHLAHQFQRNSAASDAASSLEDKSSRKFTSKQRSNHNSVQSTSNSSSNMIERLIPLKQLTRTNYLNDNLTLTSNFNVATFEMGNFTNELVDRVTQLVLDVERGDIESLVLRNNSLEFELWAEIYSLLVVRARRNLYQLDLSHNQLAKLGVTFTGYIEHHLIASRGDWPFGQTSNQSSLLKFINLNNALVSQPLGAGGPMNLQVGKQQQQPQNQANKPYTLTSGGKLYSLVQQKLRHSSSANETQVTRNQTLNAIQIRALDLSHNSLRWLINDQFRALKHVQSIRLDNNKIRFMHQHAFTGLEALRYLNLAHNNLQVIYIEQFQSNYNLQALSLRANAIAYLRAGSFASLANLKQLDLSQNKLTILSNNAFIGLESLEWLNLSSNQFVHAPSGALHPLTALRRLDLSNNLMAQLAPGTFFHLPIEELWLNRNEQLVNIDRGAFWDMPYLSRLHLSSCPMLMTINAQAFVGMVNLNYINANDCQSLEAEARQLLENVTATATSRQQNQLVNLKTSTLNRAASDNASKINSIESAENSIETKQDQIMRPLVPQLQLQPPHLVLPKQSLKASVHVTPAAAVPDDVSHVIDIANNRLKYAYYATSLVFLIVALKLVLKYTQVNSGSLRSRRRVYETGLGDAHCGPEADGLSLNGCDTYELQSRQGRIQSVSSSSSAELSTGDLEESKQETPGGETSAGEQGASNELDGMVEIPLDDQVAEAAIEQLNEQPDLTACVDPTNEMIEENEATDQQQQQQVILSDNNENNNSPVDGDPSIVCDQMNALMNEPCTCENCPQMGAYSHMEPQQTGVLDECTSCEQCNSVITSQEPGCDHQQTMLNSSGQQQEPTLSHHLLQTQLMASSYDFDHANCNHFYQTLGSALQFADLVNGHLDEDYY